MKRFKEFKLSRGWRVTVSRPDCLMEVPPVLGVRASGTGQLYERRLHLARYWLRALYGAYCVGGSADTVGTPLCKRTLGWLQPWVCTSVITRKKKKKKRKKKTFGVSFPSPHRRDLNATDWKKRGLLPIKTQRKAFVSVGGEREKNPFIDEQVLRKK